MGLIHNNFKNKKKWALGGCGEERREEGKEKGDEKVSGTLQTSLPFLSGSNLFSSNFLILAFHARCEIKYYDMEMAILQTRPS